MYKMDIQFLKTNVSEKYCSKRVLYLKSSTVPEEKCLWSILKSMKTRSTIKLHNLFTLWHSWWFIKNYKSGTTLPIYILATSKYSKLTEQARLLTSYGKYCLSLTMAIPLRVRAVSCISHVNVLMSNEEVATNSYQIKQWSFFMHI
jgi:hypothetical protein